MYEDCIKHDILFLLEPIHFPFNGEKDGAKSQVERKATTVIESAKFLSRYCDIYKSEFPGTFGHESDAQLMDNLKRLNDACAKPWVLLSAGVDYDKYRKQVEMAMKAGASGILGGLWEKVRQRPEDFLDLRTVEKEGLDVACQDFIAGMTDRYAFSEHARLVKNRSIENESLQLFP